MHVQHTVPTAQAETSDRWREAVRERWRTTLLSAWARDTAVADGAVTACSTRIAFLRQKPRMARIDADRR